MLLLSFNIGAERYAVETQFILEVIPLVPVDHIPLLDPAIRGIIHYRGKTLVTIDLSMCFNQTPSESRLSSRIIVCQINIQQTPCTVGLIAEHVTETLQCNESDLEDNGITDQKKHFLGKIYRHQQQNIQIINSNNLLPDNIQQQLLNAQK